MTPQQTWPAVVHEDALVQPRLTAPLLLPPLLEELEDEDAPPLEAPPSELLVDGDDELLQPAVSASPREPTPSVVTRKFLEIFMGKVPPELTKSAHPTLGLPGSAVSRRSQRRACVGSCMQEPKAQGPHLG